MEERLEEEHKRIRGKITKLDKSGWGFILSNEDRFKRFFFHWSALNPGTLNFTDLCKGMTVEFNPVHYFDRDGEDKGWRAYKIDVIENPIEEAQVENL